jgi:phenylacetate-CoA ligase
MYPTLLSRVIFPGLDLFNRTQIAKSLRFLEEAEHFSLDQLRELQNRKLDDILGYAGANSTFYRDLWDEAPTGKRAASLYPQLDGLPVIDKQDLRSSTEPAPLPCFNGRALRINSSGSTGAPTTFVRSAEQESWFWALRIRMWRWAGFELGTPYLAMNLNPRTAWRKRLQDQLFRCTYLTYNADNVNSSAIVDVLKQNKIVHINAFGSTLIALAEFMTANGIENPGIRVLTSTGDNLFAPQREIIEKAFGVGVSDYYGAGGEGVHLASQCEEHDRYHVHMENSVFEILKDGRPALPGELGNIVVTQLDNRAMPLIRYDIGDLAMAGDDTPCPCGRAHPTIAAIHGRACDVIRTPSGKTLLPQFFFIGSFKTLENVARYQVVQEQLERVCVKLVAEPGCDQQESEANLRSYLDAASDGSLTIDFDWVDEIPLAGLGKPRPVVSKLGATGPAAPPAPAGSH